MDGTAGFHTLPSVRLTIDRMQHTVLAMLSEYSGTLDEGIRVAVERVCSKENVEQVLAAQVQAAIDEALRGELADQVKSAVRAALWDEGVRTALKQRIVNALTSGDPHA